MASVGVRELRQRASELLRRVAAGETIEITDRNRPVALLTPIDNVGPMERLRRAGEIIPATMSLDELGPPLRLRPGEETASSALARLRRDER